MKLPRQFFPPLAIGAPAPLRELPVRLERMIHFVPPHIEKVRAKVPELVRQVDVVLGNLEDAIPADAKEAARDGFIAMAQGDRLRRDRAVDAHQRAELALGARRHHRDRRGGRRQARRHHAAQGRGPWDIHYLDQLLAQLEARHALKKPILIHAILETAQGVNNVEAIAAASPRMHGMSLGPADLAASRGMKTTRVGGGHPDYGVLADAQGDATRARLPAGPVALHHRADGRRLRRRRHQAVLRPVRRLLRSGRLRGAVPQRLPDGLRRRLVAASGQIDIAKRVFSPDPAEVAFAKKIVAAMPDGTGAVMIDGKMQDDATWKQAKVMVDLARLVAAKDPELPAIRISSL